MGIVQVTMKLKLCTLVTLIICLSKTQNYSRWYLNNILSDWLWAKTSSTRKKWCKVRLCHLTAWPTYKKNTADVLPQDVSERFQLRSAEGKQGTKHLPLLKFASWCCLFTKFLSRHKIRTRFWGDSVQNFFHTSSWNVDCQQWSIPRSKCFDPTW